MERAFETDFEVVKEKVEEVNAFISQVTFERQNKEIFSDDFCTMLENKKKELKRFLNAPFNLMITGDFKRGKSSFVNALLEKELLPTAVTPETVTINSVSYAEESCVEVYFENNTKQQIQLDDLKRENLEVLLAETQSKVKYISVKDNNEILKNINIVDTPGLNDAAGCFDDMVIECLSKADAVIYVVSAQFPMSGSEQEFLSNIIVPGALAKLFVVINMCDCLEDEDEIRQITEYTKKKCHEIAPDIQVFAISSLDELSRLKNVKRPNEDTSSLLENNFNTVSSRINSEIVYNKESLKADNCINHAKQLLQELSGKCISVNKVLNEKSSDFSKLLEAQQNELKKLDKEAVLLREKISEVTQKQEKQASFWMSEYLARVKVELENATKDTKTGDIEKHIKFYFSDILKRGLEACLNAHLNELSSLFEVGMSSISINDKALNTSVLDNSINIERTLDRTLRVSESMEIMDTLGSATGLSGFLYGYINTLPSCSKIKSILSVVQYIPFVSSLIREKNKESANTKYILSEQIISTFHQIEEKTIESVEIMYDTLKKNLLENIEASYEEKKQKLEDQHEQEKLLLQADARDRERILDQVSYILEQTNERYKSLCFVDA